MQLMYGENWHSPNLIRRMAAPDRRTPLMRTVYGTYQALHFKWAGGGCPFPTCLSASGQIEKRDLAATRLFDCYVLWKGTCLCTTIPVIIGNLGRPLFVNR